MLHSPSQILTLIKEQDFRPAPFLLPAVGLEPTRGYPQQILSLHRLPFRHAGIFAWLITKQIDIIIPDLEMQVLFSIFSAH